MIRRMHAALLGATTVALVACTSFTARQVDISGPPESIPHGIIVPDQVPLLVIADGKPSILMVKSPDRGTAIRFKAFLAKNDTTIEFATTGGLSKIVSNQDSTAFPLKLLDLVKPLTDKLPGAFGLSGTTDGAASSVQLYNIIFEDGKIVGLEPLLFTPEDALAGRCGARRYATMECVANFPPPRLAVDPAVTRMEPVPSVGGKPVTGTPAAPPIITKPKKP